MKTVRIFSARMAMISIALLAVSCGGNSPADPDPKPDPDPIEKKLTHEQQLLEDGYYHDVLKDGWEKETKARADLMLIQWSPLKTLPSTVRDVTFNAGETVTGIPYSSLFNEKGLLAENVSFHTFLSTLANPKSLMYTTDYRPSTTQKYVSKCTYYGTQCTESVQFSWGLPFHQDGIDIFNGRIPYIKKLNTVDMQDLEIFDGVLYSDGFDEGAGHMMMVYDVLRDKDGNTVKLVIFEGAHPTVRITTYTLQEFKARLDEQPCKTYFFRIDRVNYSSLVRLPSFVEQSTSLIDRTFPTAVCPDRGDKVSYAVGTPVNLNILSSGYSRIELYKDEALHQTRPLAGTEDVTFSELPVGLYKACLATDSSKSDFTFFEVADPTFIPSLEGNKLYINCNGSTYEPLFISCNVSSSYPVSTRLQLKKVSDGKWVYEGSLGDATHVRAHFACKYSSVSGQSIRFKK